MVEFRCTVCNYIYTEVRWLRETRNPENAISL